MAKEGKQIECTKIDSIIIGLNSGTDRFKAILGSDTSQAQSDIGTTVNGVLHKRYHDTG